MGTGLSKEKMDECRSVIKDKFNEKEINHMWDLYSKHANKGKMGRAQFKKYVAELGIISAEDEQEAYVDQLFRGYDRDRDGTISFKEYLQYHLGIMFSTEELFDIVFSMYDADADGTISKKELVDVVTNSTRWMGSQHGDCDPDSPDVRSMIDAEVNKILTFVDVNKDGKITKQELYAAAAKHPEILERLKNLA
eukprot:RCo012489